MWKNKIYMEKINKIYNLGIKINPHNCDENCYRNLRSLYQIEYNIKSIDRQLIEQKEINYENTLYNNG